MDTVFSRTMVVSLTASEQPWRRTSSGSFGTRGESSKGEEVVLRGLKGHTAAGILGFPCIFSTSRLSHEGGFLMKSAVTAHLHVGRLVKCILENWDPTIHIS